MKRTFTTAAAVLAAGGVGAVGMATPALAAGGPQLPATLPTDNGMANTAFHAVGTLASAQKTVGDVVPLDQQMAGRGGDPVTDALGSTPAGGALKPVVDVLGQASSGQTHGLDPVSALQQAKPVGSTLPASKSGPGDVIAPVTETLGQLPLADQLPLAGQLPLAKTGTVDGPVPTSLTGTLENTAPVATTQSKPGQLPSTNVVGDTLGKAVEGAGTNVPLGRSGDPVSGLVGGSPVGGLPGGDALGSVTGNLPVGKSGSPVGGLPGGDALGSLTGNLPVGKSGSPVGGLPGGDALGSVTGNLPVGKSGSPVDEVTGVASHGPLGGVTQLGN